MGKADIVFPAWLKRLTFGWVSTKLPFGNPTKILILIQFLAPSISLS